jgi:hypothetical protein
MISIEKNITSQNGEDGIIEFMISHLKDSKNYFFEIGWGNGKWNMSYNLMQQGWSGTGVDIAPCEINLPQNVKFIQDKITPDNILNLSNRIPNDTDFFSLDIDSYDYEISCTLLKSGFRPKIVCVEINKRFGNKSEASYPYEPDAPRKSYHKFKRSGVSLVKYIKLWEHLGYNFFTCDSTYTNAFFYLPDSLTAIKLEDSCLLDNMPGKDDVMINHIKENEYWTKNISKIYKPFSIDDIS